MGLEWIKMNLPMTKVSMIESKQSFPRTTFKVIVQLPFAFLPFCRERTKSYFIYYSQSLRQHQTKH
jgi:hypothetical protein